MSGTCLYILLCDLCISASGVPEIFPLLDCCICMFYHYTGHDVSDRRTYTENLCGNTWNPCWCYSCRGFCLVFQQGIRNFRIQCFGLLRSLMSLWNTNRIQVGGLLFSGLLISCLGAVMDVAMSISSAIDEIYRQNLSLFQKRTF